MSEHPSIVGRKQCWNSGYLGYGEKGSTEFIEATNPGNLWAQLPLCANAFEQASVDKEGVRIDSCFGAPAVPQGCSC